MAKLLIDQMLSDYNTNKKPGKPALERNSFGRLIWDDKTEASIKTTLSLWASESSDSMPSLSCMKTICKTLNLDYNTFMKKYVKP